MSLSNAKFYKCKQDDGAIVYQKSICNVGKQEKVLVSATSKELKTQKKYKLSSCLEELKESLSFKSKRKIKIKKTGTRTMEVINYLNTKMTAYAVPITLNVKNKGKEGSKKHFCYFSVSTGKFLQAK